MSDHNPLTLKLNLREKIAYGMGDVGSNLMLCIGTLYLLKFYTDELWDACLLWRDYLSGGEVFYRVYRYAHRIFTRLAEKYWA